MGRCRYFRRFRQYGGEAPEGLGLARSGKAQRVPGRTGAGDQNSTPGEIRLLATRTAGNRAKEFQKGRSPLCEVTESWRRRFQCRGRPGSALLKGGPARKSVQSA